MSHQKAIVMDGTSASVVTNRAIPELRPGYVLVQVKAVALNPTDWKSVARTNIKDATLGCDFAGVVEKTGEGYEKQWKVGDRIAGLAFGANNYHHEDGAFAEHILVKADAALRMPDNMSFEAAATLGVGYHTCGQGLFSRTGLQLNGPDNPTKDGEKLFIYGGSTATGTLGIQLAKLAGYTVYTVCSPENFELVKSLGAKEAFNYKDPESPEKIKAAAGGEFKYIWDTMTLPTSTQFCMKLIQPGGRYWSLSPPASEPRSDIKKGWTLAYTVLGEPVKKGTFFEKQDTSEDFEDAKRFVATFNRLLENGEVKPHPYTVSDKGIDGILDGLKLLEENKVSGKKLVYTL